MSLEPTLANLAIVERECPLSRQNDLRGRLRRTPPDVVLLFLKAPRPGFAKTRLAAALGKRRTLDLHRAFVGDTLSWLAEFPRVERRLLYTPAGSAPECAALLPAGSGHRFRWEPQGRGGLGARLSRAFASAFADGARGVVALGTDAPLCGPRLLGEALQALRRRDVVLGPARDGGYYLVGARADEPGIFRRIPWSTSSVLPATLRRVEGLGLSHALLSTLGDVDTRADLERLRKELLERWRKPGREPFPLRTFRTLAWMGLDGLPWQVLEG